jgi:hypothetical protein
MLMKPHRGHVYQLLVNEMGIEHWKVSVVKYLVATGGFGEKT